MKIAVLYGGRSGEHEVSRNSAASIIANLGPAYDVTEVLIGRDGQWHVDQTPVDLAGALNELTHQDVVFPALHGPYGEDGTVQAVLEWIGVPYVGNGVLASAAGMDKAVTKTLLAAEGLRVAGGVTLRAGQHPTDTDQRLPVFVKPARAGSSLGVSRVTDWWQLPEALATARMFDDKVLIEPAIRGREVDVGVLEHPDGRVEAGPPLEINVTGEGFFDYDAKYRAGGAHFQIPAHLDPAMTETLKDRAIRAFQALGCRGLIRVDFFLPDDEDEPVVNEVNTFPGFTSQSQYPQIWQRAGIAYPELLDILIAGALRNRQGRSAVPGAARR
ncbi:D-alanine--D-alanine ligase [Asanoa sp. WMMD1127]|uniref:D-alanine--D-alanine ligase family protein n=1 Tax=Asanoa sp. WMMD1127 TaxID=3016107 RepID=UPI0024162BB1|nr:D-alanine--D-alanine ligase family protein [Asanoa sp. WMMD1127]MDG4823198.1 D-alanine--D-alanine ligase [Asanoa sp. WMMD1127]